MSERSKPDLSDDVGEELPGFFGAEHARPTEEVDPELWVGIDDYLRRNAGGKERLIPLLHKLQETLGYLPFSVQEAVADKLGLSPIEVYGVVSFYHFFTTAPRSRHEIKLCMGTACFVRHARRLLEAARRTLDVDVDGVTEDRRFSLEQVRCLGSCGMAPAVVLDKDTLGNLTPRRLRELLLEMRSRDHAVEEPESSESSGG